MSEEPYELILSPAARRSLSAPPPRGLAEAAAAAIWQFLSESLRHNPYRMGKATKPPFEDLRSARRGEYRILFEVVEKTRTIRVSSIRHRSNAYRP